MEAAAHIPSHSITVFPAPLFHRVIGTIIYYSNSIELCKGASNEEARHCKERAHPVDDAEIGIDSEDYVLSALLRTEGNKVKFH